MPKRIDHEKRKIEILSAALEAYATEGKNVNLSLIASRCNLSRTTVYQYFKDESQLFSYAIKYTTDVIFSDYTSEAFNAVTDDPVEKLYMITTDIMNRADSYEKQIGNFLKTLDKVDGLSELIKHRTAKLVLLFSRLVRQAVKEEKMGPCSPREVAEKLEVGLESYLFHIVVFPQNKAIIREMIADIIRINLL